MYAILKKPFLVNVLFKVLQSSIRILKIMDELFCITKYLVEKNFLILSSFPCWLEFHLGQTK